MSLWDSATALKRLYRGLFVCFIMCLLVAVGFGVVNSAYFPVKRVVVKSPLKHIQATQLQSIVHQYLSDNIFRINVNGAQKALIKMPWVARAEVKRLWPSAVELNITERVPVARWSNQRLVDNQGVVFDVLADDRYPLLLGRPQDIKSMVQQLAVFEQILNPLNVQITQLAFSDRGAWTVTLRNGIIIRLGREDTLKRLKSFAWAWPRVLKEQEATIDYVDMRYLDGFAVRQHGVHKSDTVEASETK